MKVPLIIIGGGLSGLAAAIRFARYNPEVLLLEKHTKIGGLNSYYYRKNILLETGLHAITNYAPAEEKHAPLNRLFRQLKLKRKDFVVYPQYASEILFSENKSITFTNDFRTLKSEIAAKFPASYPGFKKLCKALAGMDPFKPEPFRSAKKFLLGYLEDELLCEMLLCPLMYYGSCLENDLDLGQFIIMFRSIYQEGMFRPEGTMKSFLDSLQAHYEHLGGTLRTGKEVKKILHHGKKALGVELADGEVIESDYLLSTVGFLETQDLLGNYPKEEEEKRLGFTESIFYLKKSQDISIPREKTIIFYNTQKTFTYARPETPVDVASGVICFPENFQGRPEQQLTEIRATHLSNFHKWPDKTKNPLQYSETKAASTEASLQVLQKFVGNFRKHIVYQDTFTPLTIKNYTSKIDGAIYGSPRKIKDGDIGYTNLFLAGTDQGFLGIVGSMLSGVSMVNQHILPKI